MVLQLLIAVALWAAPPAPATHAAGQRFWTFVVDPVATPIVLLHERPDGSRRAERAASGAVPGRRPTGESSVGVRPVTVAGAHPSL